MKRNWYLRIFTLCDLYTFASKIQLTVSIFIEKKTYFIVKKVKYDEVTRILIVKPIVHASNKSLENYNTKFENNTKLNDCNKSVSVK